MNWHLGLESEKSEFHWCNNCNMGISSCTVDIGIQNGPQDKNVGGIEWKMSTFLAVYIALLKENPAGFELCKV